MIKVGLTGGMGTGKSVIAKIFDILSVPVFNADRVAKQIMDEDERIKQALYIEFGNKIFTSEKINRKELAYILFNNPEKLILVNKLIHPVVMNNFDNWCAEITEKKYAIMESAILFETGLYKLFNKNILVTAPREIRINRISKRDNMNRNEIIKRIENQWEDEKKIPLADFIIENDDKALVTIQVLDIHQKILNL